MLRTLIKVQFQGMFTRNFQFGKRSKRRKGKPLSKVMYALLAIYIIGSVGMALGITFNSLLTAFMPLNLLWLYFASAGMMAFLFSFIGSVYLAQSSLFSAKDNDLLLSMPIKPGHILLARTAALYLFTLAIQQVMLLPALVVYLVYGSLNLALVLRFVLLSLLLPFPVLALSILLGWLLALISSRLRRKNLVVSVLAIAAMALYFIGYSRLIAAMEDLIKRGNEIARVVRSAFPPAYHYGLGLAEGQVRSILIFLLYCLVPFVLVMALVSANYRRVLTTHRGAPRIAYKGGGLTPTSQMQALIQKEMRRFFGSPTYLMNTGISLLFMLGLPIYLAVDGGLIASIEQDLGPLTAFLGPISVAMLSLFAGSIMISSVSISMEGKALWILQTLPVAPRKALLAKALAHVLISLPVVLAAGAIMGIAFRLDAFMFAMSLVLPFLMTVFSAFLGLHLNLRFPKLEWRSETEPVKQSMSPILAMTLGFLVPATLVGLGFYFVGKGVGLRLYILLCTFVIALASLVMYLLLNRKADRAFLNLSEV